MAALITAPRLMQIGGGALAELPAVMARLGIARPLPSHFGESDDRAGAAGEVFVSPVEDAQSFGSSSSASMRLTGCSGCTVETACL